MKRKLLPFVMMVFVTIIPTKMWSQEVYAVLTDNGNTLTFYYDEQKESRSKVIEINSTLIENNGESPYGSAIQAVFSPSFANYRPTSTAFWFMNCKQLTSITGVENLKTDKVTNMEGMFYGCSNLTDLDLRSLKTSSVTNMKAMFYGCSSLEKLDLSHLNTSSVTDMTYMFSGCSSLAKLDLGHLNTSSVTNMTYMFYNCTNLTSLDVSNFKTSNVENFYGMFFGCTSLTNLDLSYFETNKARSMGFTFAHCSSLTTLDLSSFNTSNVFNMGYIFDNCPNLKTIYVGKEWTTKEVIVNAGALFNGCTSLVGGSGTTYIPDQEDDYKYACIDGGMSSPGYLTYKPSMYSTEIELTAKEENGIVKLQFNAIPNDKGYTVMRYDKDGAAAIVAISKESIFPALMEYVDIPPAAGSYSYVVAMDYDDGISNQYFMKLSNSVVVKISEMKVVGYGYIAGRIECDKNPPMTGVKVKFSDGVTVPVHRQLFMRAKIKEGEQLTMTVLGDDSHEYESPTVEIQPGLNFMSLRGTLKSDYTPNENEHDLQIYPDLEFYVRDSRHFVKFTLYNPNENYVWEGSIIAELVHKDDISVLQKWRGERPTYRGEVTDIEISKDRPIELEIFMRGMKVLKESDFKFYLTSKGRWKRTNIQEEITEKSIISTTGWDMAGYEVRIDKTESNQYANWDDEAKDDFSYLIMGLSSLTPGMEGIFGNFDSYEYHDKMVEFAKEYTGEGNEFQAVKSLFGYVQEWIGGKTVLETLNELSTLQILFNGSSVAKNIFVELKNIFLPEKSILQKFRKDVIVNIDDIHSANAMIGNLLSAYNAVKSLGSSDTFQQIMTCASTLYGLTAATYVPLNSMMYTYGVAGEKLINAAKQLQQVMHDAELPDRLIANNYRFNAKNGVHESGDPSYNTTCDFKLTVRNTWGNKVNFRKEKRNKQIKDITISASNDPDNLWVTTYKFDMRYLDDGIMLEIRPSDTLFRWGVKPLIDEEEGGGSNLRKFYMTIYWANDRITIIPLNQETNGVKIACGDRGPKFDDENMKPSLYHITLTTASGMDYMADEIYLGSNKDRE
jgi:surface protein